jgi:V/A-type H+-transporting ATPase subunit I
MAVVKMNKITLIGPFLNKEKVLSELQKAGVVDIIEKEREELPQFKEMVILEKINKTLDIFEKYEDVFSSVVEEGGFKPKDIDISKDLSKDIESLCDEIIQYTDDIDTALTNLANLHKAIKTQKLWGDFDYNRIKELKEKHDIYIQFWSTSDIDKAQFREGDVPIIIRKEKKKTYFITINRKPYEAITYCNEAIFYHSVKDIERAIQDNEKSILNKKSKLYHLKNTATERLEKGKIEYINKVEFKKAKSNLHNEIEGHVYILGGWCPIKELDRLESALEKQSVYMIREEPTREDDIPVEIENGPFTKLFEPITRLFMLPDYFQLDLTAVFAPLFWLFFGLCLGDAGWGAIILVGAVVAHSVVKDPGMKRLLRLGMLFGFSTVVMGLLMTGTIMGFKTENIPILSDILIVENEASRNLMLFYLSLIIGVIQIFIGLITNSVNSFRNEGWQEGLYPIGSIIFNLGIFLLAAKIVNENFPTIPPYITFPLLLTGLLIILLFNTKGHIGKRIGGGLWALYNVITGFFGDVLSYVRLFALGLAGSVLGNVINQIGGSLMEGISIPGLNYVVYLLFLIPLHLLMMALSALGSFVHPLRLTFVEFYNNAGFKGTLNNYKPFSLKKYKGSGNK